jgi:hypothetical protein
MAYIVETDDSEDRGFCKTVGDRKGALAVAVKWTSGGRRGVKVTGDGRVYTAAELARVINEQGW